LSGLLNSSQLSTGKAGQKSACLAKSTTSRWIGRKQGGRRTVSRKGEERRRGSLGRCGNKWTKAEVWEKDEIWVPILC
jgi:hypothetical protein